VAERYRAREHPPFAAVAPGHARANGRRLHEARQQYEGAKALDESLFGEDFETA
jgi:hypothetical protein